MVIFYNYKVFVNIYVKYNKIHGFSDFECEIPVSVVILLLILRFLLMLQILCVNIVYKMLFVTTRLVVVNVWVSWSLNVVKVKILYYHKTL